MGRPTLSRGQDRSLEIFISYRRDDAAAHAGRLHDALVARFGTASVFMDVDNIEPGVDFTEAIDLAVGHCDVLIALIGPHWLDAANARGRRLDDPKDLVRLEIQAALARNIRVIPTLVGGAQMPDAGELPGDLSSLSKRNAVELTHARFQSDLQLLIKPLEKIAQEKGVLAPVPPAPLPAPLKGRDARENAPSRRSKMPLIAGAAALVLLVGIAGWFGLTRLGPNKLLSQNSAAATWPGSYVGTWKGTGHEFSPQGDFAITMLLKPGNVGQNVGHIDRPSLGCGADLTMDSATSQSISLTEQGGGGTCVIANQNVTGTKIVVARKGASLDWKEYGGDPSKSSAIASAVLAEGSGGAIPGTSTLLAVPDAFLGIWKGTGHVSSPPDDFAVTMIIKPGQVGQTVATMQRPTLGCGADLTLDKATTQAITLTEQGGGGTCVADNQNVTGSKIVVTLHNGTLDWKEYQGEPASSSAISTAILGQGASGPIAGTSNLVAVPDGFLGTWRGTGHEASPSGDFAITIIIRVGQVGETVANMQRPTLGCGADLVLDKATTQAITLTELGGGGTCVVANQNVTGSKLVLTLNGSSIDWKEYNGDPSTNPGIASATLSTG